ncbi:MAG: YdeI/OmpD-associated family protein [Clostridia bacterium]|nr:YdeI/OmpD-associated family protein [Clostridia bacterium]
MHTTEEIKTFANRQQFREWLYENCLTSEGVWLLFGKQGGPKTIKADEALEEALCFGWIDGQMQSLDDKTYRKYFSLRRQNSKWSVKNKELVKCLEERGLMTDFGRKKIEEAKKNGQWDAKNPLAIITDEQIADLAVLLEKYEPAYTNFQAMPLSVKKTYTRAYLDAKTDAGREKRIAWMVDRLNKNLRPM